MLIINEQFVARKIIPTMEQILGDLTKHDSSKVYRDKILNHQSLGETDRRQFELEYFQGVQPQDQRPFLEESEQEYRQIFLDGIYEYIQIQSRLSGRANVQNRIFPSENKKYGQDSEYTRNIRQFALWLCRKIESETIKKMQPEMTVKEYELFKSGQLKIIYQNGLPVVVSQQELSDMRLTDVQVMISPRLSSGNDDTTTGTYTTGEIFHDFAAAEHENIQFLLEEAGLNVLELKDKDENGLIQATVEDKEGQKLDVTVNTNRKNSHGEKFTFKFKEKTADGKSPRSFSISQNDLKNNFLENEERQSAEDVYKKLHEKADTGEGEKPYKPGVGYRPHMPDPKSTAQDENRTDRERGFPQAGILSLNTDSEALRRLQAQKSRRNPTATEKTETDTGFRVVKPPPGHVERPTNAKVGTPKTPPQANQTPSTEVHQQENAGQSTMQRKQELASRPTVEGQNQTPHDPSGSMGSKIATASAGGMATALGILGAGAFLAGGEEEAITFIINCLGLICLA
jgi:hypothetical protein